MTLAANDDATLRRYEAIADEFEAVARTIVGQLNPDTVLACQLRDLADQIRQGTAWMSAA